MGRIAATVKGYGVVGAGRARDILPILCGYWLVSLAGVARSYMTVSRAPIGSGL